MTNLKKLAVIFAVIIGIIVFYGLAARFNQQEEFPKVIKAYKEKGKKTQIKMEDINKGFK